MRLVSRVHVFIAVVFFFCFSFRNGLFVFYFLESSTRDFQAPKNDLTRNLCCLITIATISRLAELYCYEEKKNTDWTLYDDQEFN